MSGTRAVGSKDPDAGLAARMADAERLHRAGALEEALVASQQAVGRFPREPEPLFRLALVLGQRGDLPGAESALRSALQLAEQPRYLFALADTLERQARPRDAIDTWARAVALDKGFARAHARLGIALMDTQRHREALDALQAAVSLDPQDVRSWWNLGVAHETLYDDERAAYAYERFVALRPEEARGWERLGHARLRPGLVLGAREAFAKAVALMPGRPEAWLAWGTALAHLGETRKAIDALGQAEVLRPPDADRIGSQRLVVMHYDPGFSAQTVFDAHRDWARRYAPPRAARPFSNPRDSDRVIRVGYLSPRFHESSVSSLSAHILERHDPARFEVFCYAEQNVEDAVTRRIQAASRGWCITAGLPDEAVADQIRRDGIDVLIDLAGHTPGHRLQVLAHRPSPVQGTWLDYFNTTGLETVDFLISDAEHSPPGDDQPFIERVVRMPALRYCWEPPPEAPDIVPLPPSAGRTVVFGSFSRLAKLSSQTLDVWCAVLKAVPDSRMILKSTALAGPAERRHVSLWFAARGVDPDRVELRGPSSHAALLAQYNDIDISLDTFPYNGGLTTLESLWMGRPVVTLDGATLISRQSRAILATLGLRQWVARDADDFVRIAARLAQDRQGLVSIACGMRERMAGSPVLDASSFVRALEAVYRAQWERWCVHGSRGT